MAWFNFHIYLMCLIGIVISVVLPILWAYVRTHFPLPAPAGPQAKSLGDVFAFWTVARPYAALGLASALTALLLIAFLGDALVDPRAAILAGYAWDSTLQKLR